MKVQKLANAVGVALYAKAGRGLTLTPAGAALAQHARNFDRELERILGELNRTSTPPVTIAAGAGTYSYVISQAMRVLIDRLVVLRLLTTDRDATIKAVRNGGADVGVTVVNDDLPDLAVTKLAEYPQMAVMAAGHPLARRRSVKLVDLAETDLILPPPRRPLRESIDRALSTVSRTARVVAEAEGWAQMLHFAGLGIGVCVVNGCVRLDDGLVGRPVDDLPSVAYSALYRADTAGRPDVRGALDALLASVP